MIYTHDDEIVGRRCTSIIIIIIIDNSRNKCIATIIIVAITTITITILLLLLLLIFVCRSSRAPGTCWRRTAPRRRPGTLIHLQIQMTIRRMIMVIIAVIIALMIVVIQLLRLLSIIQIMIHPVSVIIFPSFRTQPLEILAATNETNISEQPSPWRKSSERELVIETGCTTK